MSIFNVFVEAFKKAANRKPEIDTRELVRNEAGLGVSADTDAFEPIKREAPSAPGPGPDSDLAPSSNLAVAGEPATPPGQPIPYPNAAATSDLKISGEELGSPLPESPAPPTIRSAFEDAAPESKLASSDPEEGGEVVRPELKIETAFRAPEPLNVSSADPEEGGEVTPGSLKVEAPLAGSGELKIASSDPEEGGEVSRGLGLSKDTAPGIEGFKPLDVKSEGMATYKLEGQVKIEDLKLEGQMKIEEMKIGGVKFDEPLKQEPIKFEGGGSPRDDALGGSLAPEPAGVKVDEAAGAETQATNEGPLYPLQDGRNRPAPEPEPDDDSGGDDDGPRFPFQDGREGIRTVPTSTLVDLEPDDIAAMPAGRVSPDDAFKLELDDLDLDDDADLDDLDV